MKKKDTQINPHTKTFGVGVNLFEYKDYRAFLRDWFLEAKGRSRAFSFRFLAKRAGFKSSNFIMLVMEGRRNLTEESLVKLMNGMKLNKQEQDFFKNLVYFNQAKTDQEKDLYYKKLLQSKKFRQLKPIERKQYEYYSNWYHPVIRELVVSKDFDGTPEWLASRVDPPITPVQAAKSVELLEGLGLIERLGPNKWRQASTVISTGPEVSSIVVHNYHKELLELAGEVMDKPSMEERDVSALTLGVKKERLAEIKAKIREFRQEILKMVAGDSEPEEVAQLQIQFFKVTRDNKKRKGGEIV